MTDTDLLTRAKRCTVVDSKDHLLGVIRDLVAELARADDAVNKMSGIVKEQSAFTEKKLRELSELKQLRDFILFDLGFKRNDDGSFDASVGEIGERMLELVNIERENKQREEAGSDAYLHRWVPANHARAVERENAALREALEHAEREIDRDCENFRKDSSDIHGDMEPEDHDEYMRQRGLLLEIRTALAYPGDDNLQK